MKNWITITIIGILTVAVLTNGYFYLQDSAQLGDIRTQVTALKATAGALGENISALKAEVSSNFAALSRDTATLSQDTSGLKADVSTLTGNVSTLTSNLKDSTDRLSGNITALQGNIDSLGKKVTSNFETFQAYTSASPDAVTKLSPAMVRVEVRITGAAASGSGSIIDKKGYVLTNYHVIQGATSIKITLASGDAYDATVVSSDQDRDLAILKIGASREFPAAVLGSTDDIIVGREVLAIGYPLGSSFTGSATVTRGIISAMRTVDSHRYIQTDAAINPGNSGGCLITLDGKIIGIPSARIISSNLQIQSIGLAIPIDEINYFVHKVLG